MITHKDTIGAPITVGTLQCTMFRDVEDYEYNKIRIKYGFEEFSGESSFDINTALNNTLRLVAKRFPSFM